MGESRPTYYDALLAYLSEGYSAYQERRDASAALVRQKLEFSRQEAFEFEKHVVELAFIDLGGHAERRIAAYRLLPKGRLLMEQWPAIERAVTKYEQAIEEAPATSQKTKSHAKRWLRDYIVRKVLDEGIDSVWENRQTLWAMLRAQFPDLPDLFA
jgi:hypothetical protein